MPAYRDEPGWQYLSHAAQDEAAVAAREAAQLAESAAALAAAQARAPCLLSHKDRMCSGARSNQH